MSLHILEFQNIPIIFLFFPHKTYIFLADKGFAPSLHAWGPPLESFLGRLTFGLIIMISEISTRLIRRGGDLPLFRLEIPPPSTFTFEKKKISGKISTLEFHYAQNILSNQTIKKKTFSFVDFIEILYD